MPEGHSENSAVEVLELCARSEALHRAGRLNDAIAVLRGSDLAASATQPDQLRILLEQGRYFTDQIFHANREYDEAMATLESASVLAQRLDDQVSAAKALDMMGYADYYQVLQAGGRDYGALLGRFQAALARREELSDSRGVADSLFHIGLIHERLGENDAAREMYSRAYALATERHHHLELSYAARHLGGLALEAGDLDVALRLFRESLALRQEAGYTLLLPLAHIALGETLLARNEMEGAASQYEQAHTLAQGMQSPLIKESALLALCELAHARGDEEARRDYAVRALSHAQENNLPLGVRAAEAALATITQERA
jgi:tetratricopeptide (TPR) repeat protein